MLIDASNSKTIPIEISQAIINKFDELAPEIVSEIKKEDVKCNSDVMCAVEKYFGTSVAYEFYQNLLKIFEKHELICFHSTRVLDENVFYTTGLQINDWDNYQILLKQTLQNFEIDEFEIRRVIEEVKKEYDRKYGSGRKPQICFFSDIGLLRHGYDQFCESIGGELARWALKDKYPQIYNYLRENGRPYLVKFKILFCWVNESWQHKIMYQFVLYYAAKYFWNFNYKIHFDGDVNRNISANEILEVIPYKK